PDPQHRSCGIHSRTVIINGLNVCGVRAIKDAGDHKRRSVAGPVLHGFSKYSLKGGQQFFIPVNRPHDYAPDFFAFLPVVFWVASLLVAVPAPPSGSRSRPCTTDTARTKPIFSRCAASSGGRL